MLVESAYRSWKNWNSEGFGACSPALRKAYLSIFPIHNLRGSGKAALDFGFGNGEILAILKELGYSVSGIEIDASLVSLANSCSFSAYKSIEHYITDNGAGLSLITSFHCLEHLSRAELEETFVKFADILVPNGIILASFPNGDSPFSLRAFSGDLTHQTLIGSSMAHQLASLAGLSLISYSPFPPVSLYSSSLIARLKSFSRLLIERAFSKMLLYVYYGGNSTHLNPITYAIWQKQ